jgi:hypothetical protein
MRLGINNTSLLGKLCFVSGVVGLFTAFTVFLGGFYEGAEYVGLALDFSTFDLLSTASFLCILAITRYFSQHCLWLLNLVPDYVLRHLAAKPKPLFIVPTVISQPPTAHGSRAPPLFS